MNAREQIEHFEGRRSHSYPDPLTGGAPWTIGIGHCGPEVTPGCEWTDAQIDEAFSADVQQATHQCSLMWQWFDALNEPRQAVLINMVFQMGLEGVIGFKGTLAAIEAGRYADAAQHMQQSLWARQTPRRANTLAAQMEVGEWMTA